MDKRWILILIILIIGLGLMYCTADNSNTVGSAITTFGKTTITIPDGFSVGETESNSEELFKKGSTEVIRIYDFGKDSGDKNILKNLTKEYIAINEYKNISYNTTKIDNIKIHQAMLETHNDTHVISSFYLYEHTYILDMSGYKDMNSLNKDLEFILDTIHPDYKQSDD